MGYAVNRKGFSRTGFRPTGTNPFAASHRTHLGQTHPFRPEPGYDGMRGLGDMVPQNAVVQYTGNWSTTINTTPDQQLAEVVAALQQDGFHVLSSSQSGGFLGEMFTGSFTATLQLQVLSGGFSQPSDIGSIVDHEAYLASGIMPSGSQVSVVAAGTPGAGLPAGLPTDWNAWLQQNAMWIGLAIVGVVVLPEVLDKL